MSSTNFKLDEYIMHHVLNGQAWNLPFAPAIPIPAPLSLHFVMMVFVVLIVLVLIGAGFKRNERIPKGFTLILETFVLFIRDQIAVPSLGKEDGNKFTPMFCTIFIFILSMNVLGLIPLFASPTSNINVTAALALIVLFFMTIGAVARNGIGGFVHALIPSGLPKPMIPFFFILEFFLIFIKTFALAIRLFANLLAGHMIIYALLGLVIMLGLVALPAVFLAVGIYALEVLVAFLQAFIFTLLSAVFIGQMYHPEH